MSQYIEVTFEKTNGIGLSSFAIEAAEEWFAIMVAQDRFQAKYGYWPGDPVKISHG